MNIWPRMTQHLNIFLQKCKQKHELWPFTKTNHSFISERELKYVIFFIRYCFLSFLFWSINVILMEICPGRWNSCLFTLLFLFNYYAMDKIDSGKVNNSMEYFGYILHCYCCIWLFFWGIFCIGIMDANFYEYHTHWISMFSTYNLVSGQKILWVYNCSITAPIVKITCT